jgi:hypothetical protein
MKIRPLHFNLTTLVTLLAATPLVLLTSGFLTRSQATNSLPTAQWILDRYVKVSGERANLVKHTSVTIRGRYQNPGDKVATSLRNATSCLILSLRSDVPSPVHPNQNLMMTGGIAHRRIVAGPGNLRNYGRNNNSQETSSSLSTDF